MLKSNNNNNHPPLIMDITVISAQGLKTPLLFSHRLMMFRPFITLTIDGNKPCHVYTTRTDNEGGTNPNWGDKFQIPIDPNFLYQRQSCVYLQLYTKGLVAGQTQIGWCQIPAADIADGIAPAGYVRHLSYRLRKRDGSRGHGVVNIAAKVMGSIPMMGCPLRPLIDGRRQSPEVVVGIPVKMLPAGSW